MKLTKFLALHMCELIITTVLHLSTTRKRGLWRCAENGRLFCHFFTALGTFSHFMPLFYCQRIFRCLFLCCSGNKFQIILGRIDGVERWVWRVALPFKAKRRTPQRGQLWHSVADHLKSQKELSVSALHCLQKFLKRRWKPKKKHRE